MKIEFVGYNIQPQYLRTDKSTRVLIDVSQDQLENIKDILLNKCSEGTFKITIEPEIEEIPVSEIPIPHIK